MSGLLLDDAERHRFAEYLEREAQSASAMAEQIEKTAGPVGAVLGKQERLYAAAATLIAKRLRATESFSIGKE